MKPFIRPDETSRPPLAPPRHLERYANHVDSAAKLRDARGVPSQLHQAIIELFRNRPALAAEMLTEVFAVPLPIFTEAEARPELAVLSAMAHGKTEAGFDVAVTALLASAGIRDKKLGSIYTDLVLSSLGEAAHRVMEALMFKNYQYQSDFARKYFAEGVLEGKREGELRGELKGELKTLSRQFERRLARPLTDEERARLSLRIQELGAERVGDLVLDLTSEALGAWLASPNGN